jgi:GMP reductase
MAGGIFAGHEESGGETVKVEETGKWFKKFYGMSSDVAMNLYSGGVNNYRASEGKLVYLPFKGPIRNTVLDLLGGLRSTCTYIGSGTIQEMPTKTTFIRVTQ